MESNEKQRPTLSLSLAGHCRMQLWLKAHGADKEAFTETAERTFELGHAIEKLIFDDMEITEPHSGEVVKIGGWWKRTPLITEFLTGRTLEPMNLPVTDRQMKVKVGPFVGHMDGLIWPNGPAGRPMGVDAKSSAGFGYDRAMRVNLLEDVFAREYVYQQQMYLKGARNLFESIGKVPEVWPEESALIYYNKEQSQMAMRIIKYDPLIVADGLDRFDIAQADAEPEPDFAWTKGEQLPLRCRYCEYKQACGTTRGLSVVGPVIVKSKPVWMVGA